MKPKLPIPTCQFTGQPATHIAAQSSDVGKTVQWVFVNKEYAEGWNEGGDWKAPCYPIDFGNPYFG